MRKVLTCIITLIVALSLSACSQEKIASTNHNVLVAYYSATGTTKAVAKKIANATDGTLFEITPKEVYTDEDLDWTEKSSRVNIEHEDESLQNVELVRTKVKNWKSYDTVYIGYPIWWQNAAWPINNFVKENDFSNKTVIPFCTSSSSDIGNSAKGLEKMTNTGHWLDGKRFSYGTTQADVQNWIESLK